MSDFSEWDDPFAEDEAARARDARRAEREARRRATRETLGEKAAASAADEPPEADPAPPVERPAARAAPAAAATPPPPEPMPEEGADGGSVGSHELLIRRVVGAVIVIAAIVFVGFVAGKIWGAFEDLIGGDDPAEQAPAAVKVEDLTIPEGYDRNQIAAVAEDAGLKGDYERATRRAPKGFPIDEYAPDGAADLEGFLFPDTYNLERNGSVDGLVAAQLDRFEELIKDVDMSYAESKNLNVYDVLKIASMIEREIMHDDERRLAAAVIYNRLSAGDTLGIDATIRYEDQNYDEPLTASRLEEDTPYNTRTNAGLPPTPIGNPGLASIEAAANPARSDAYYFVVKPGTCGEHVFVETEQEFAEAEAAYQQALEAQGGSPTEC